MTQLSVSLWEHGKDNECLGSWYSEEGVQVPRKGDILWLETRTVKHSRWKVSNVQWSFRDIVHGIGHTRMMVAEVWIKPKPTAPLWRRFLELFPAPRDMNSSRTTEEK